MPDPPGPGWERSALNIPAPGTIASYRKGLYHAHETESEWRIHLDRHDPKTHPIWHLIDDAPLLLMIGATFKALLTDARSRDIKARLDEQKATWRTLALFGLALLASGLFIGLDPLAFFEGVVVFLIPLVVVMAGACIILRGYRSEGWGALTWNMIVLGLAIIFIGTALVFLPNDVMAGFIFLILALWTFSSGIVILKRVSHGRSGVSEGFFKILAIGILSLLLAVAIFLAPETVVAILVELVAIIVILLGIVLIGNGLSLKRRMME